MKRPNIKDDVNFRNCGINNNKTNLTLISLDHYWFQLQWKQSLDTTFLRRFGFCYGSSLSLLFQTVSILLLKVKPGCRYYDFYSVVVLEFRLQISDNLICWLYVPLDHGDKVSTFRATSVYTVEEWQHCEHHTLNLMSVDILNQQTV